MSIQAANLIAQISVTGDAEAKAKLQGMTEATKETQGGFKSMLGGAMSFLGGMAAFALASSAVSFLKDQVSSLIEVTLAHQQIAAQMNQVLRSTHDVSGMTATALDDLASSFSKTTMFSADTVQSGENLLLTFTNIGKSVFPQATQAILDVSQAMGQDLKSSAIQVGKALGDPLKGMSALQRIGVTFSQTEKDQIKTMMAHNDIIGAQKIILKELATEFGGSATAAGKTFSGQMAIMGHQTEDLKIKIGSALLPIVTQLLGKITPLVGAFVDWATSSHAVSDIIAAFNAHSQVLIPILAGLGALIAIVLVPAVWSLAAGVIAATWPFLLIGAAVAGAVAIFMHFYQTSAPFKAFIDMVVAGLKQAAAFVMANFIPAMQQIGGFLRGTVLPILSQVGAFLISTFAPVWKQLATVWTGQILPALKQLWAALVPLEPILKIIGMVVGGALVLDFGILVGVIAGVIKAFAGLLSGVAVVIGGIVQVVTGMVQIVSGLVRFFVDLFTGNFGKLKGDLGTIWAGIINMVMGASNIMRGLFLALWGALSGYVSGFVSGVLGYFTALGAGTVARAASMIGSILSWFGSLPVKALSAIGSLPGMLAGFFGGLASRAVSWGYTIISNLASGIISGIGGALGNAMGAIGNFISSHLPASPAKMGPLRDLALQGSKIPEQIAQGMVTGLPKLQSSLNLMLAPMAMTAPMASSGSAMSAPQIIVQSPDIYLDGVRISRQLLPHIVTAIRYNTGIKL
jgi:phage-related protein